MSKILTVNGTDYTFPEQGDSPPWGTEVTDWAGAVTDVLANIAGTGDILDTQFLINNNQVSPANVTDLTFDVALIRSAIISYSIYRSTNINEVSECGQIYATYKNTANSWEIAQSFSGDAGITFNMTSGGQMQFISTNISGTGYVGRLRFSAKAFTQT